MLAAGEVTKIADVLQTIARIREARRRLLDQYGACGVQDLAVVAIAELARRFKTPGYPPRKSAENQPGVFPFSMTWVSLAGLLDSLTEAELRGLIDVEACTGELGPEVIGHVIASNTPLLGWTSVIRALLVGSASLVKAPSSLNAIWLDYFLDSLGDVSPELASLVGLTNWRGGDEALEVAALPALDLLVTYGDDDTIESIRGRSGGVPVLGYGHRVSVGFVLGDAEFDVTAHGLAVDITTFDQGGCLSPQTVFVDGSTARVNAFAQKLSQAMSACDVPSNLRGVEAAGRVREARDLAQFEQGTQVYGDSELKTTVIVRSKVGFVHSPGHCVVTVAPLSISHLAASVGSVTGKLQAASIAGESKKKLTRLTDYLRNNGVSYICKPGNMQKPTISWRENNIDVLASLLLR